MAEQNEMERARREHELDKGAATEENPRVIPDDETPAGPHEITKSEAAKRAEEAKQQQH